jgi:hypothetical protein
VTTMPALSRGTLKGSILLCHCTIASLSTAYGGLTPAPRHRGPVSNRHPLLGRSISWVHLSPTLSAGLVSDDSLEKVDDSFMEGSMVESWLAFLRETSEGRPRPGPACG